MNMYAGTYVYIIICAYTHATASYIYVCVYMCVYMHTYVFVHTYMHNVCVHIREKTN